MGTGKFRDLLVEVARDPAMLVWLDNRLNVRGRPQENFARELMELFTTGIGHYTEEDVYAAARVFTGWGLRLAGDRASAITSYYEYVYAPANHETTAKAFTFPVYTDGSRIIPARAAACACSLVQGDPRRLPSCRSRAARPESPSRAAASVTRSPVRGLVTTARPSWSAASSNARRDSSPSAA